jgi:hypothetical protein
MKKAITLFGFLFFILSMVLPLQAIARTSSLSRKINNLDNDRVEELPVPILFGVTPDNITSDFGDPRAGHTHEGQDILAPRGAPVVTPTDAVVVQVGTGSGSGYYVSTANPGGETFVYMHLDQMSELDEGDELDKGDLIGFVGNTGNASGGVTHLHFEIRHGSRATDPFPRLTRIFPLADKIKYLERILNHVDDEKKFAESMVTMYRKEFVLAKTLNIVLPEEIEQALITVPYVAPVLSSASLRIGSRGTAVITLQKFLISKNIGSASQVVADGVFGPITQRALMDYQADVRLKPVDGIYGPITRAYILAHP